MTLDQEDDSLDHARRGAMSSTYEGVELRPFNGRPGAMDAFAHPSRMGNRLYYRDGHVEQLEAD